MSAIIPPDYLTISEAVEAEGRDLHQSSWTGAELRERHRVLEILALPPHDQIDFSEALKIGPARQEARNRLVAAFRSLVAKLIDGHKSAFIVDSGGMAHPAHKAIFFSDSLWDHFATGQAPIDPGRSDAVGQLFVSINPQSEDGRAGARGRPEESGYSKLDAPFIDQMIPLVRQGFSPTKAAQQVVGDGLAVAGGGTVESKVRRLVDRLKRENGC